MAASKRRKIAKPLTEAMEEDNDEEDDIVDEDPVDMEYRPNSGSDDDKVADGNIRFHEMK